MKQKNLKPVISATISALAVWLILDFLINRQFSMFEIIKAIIFALVFGITYWILYKKAFSKTRKN